MAHDQEKTEVPSIQNAKETRSFCCAEAAGAAEEKSFQDFCRFF
jgi:hypothetical protein